MQRCRSRFDNNKLTAAWLGPWPVDGRVPRTIRIVDQLTSRGTEYGKNVANQTCLLGTWNTCIERVAHSYLTNTRADVFTTPSALVLHCIGSEPAGDGPQTFNGGKTRGRELVAAGGFDRPAHGSDMPVPVETLLTRNGGAKGQLPKGKGSTFELGLVQLCLKNLGKLGIFGLWGTVWPTRKYLST